MEELFKALKSTLESWPQIKIVRTKVVNTRMTIYFKFKHFGFKVAIERVRRYDEVRPIISEK